MSIQIVLILLVDIMNMFMILSRDFYYGHVILGSHYTVTLMANIEMTYFLQLFMYRRILHIDRGNIRTNKLE